MTKEEIEEIFIQKYGPTSLVDVGAFWNSQKDKVLREYLKFEQKFFLNKELQYFKIGQVYFSNNFLNKRTKKCCVCGRYNYKALDLKFFSLFETCYNCYVVYIEGREERWKKGWRPTT